MIQIQVCFLLACLASFVHGDTIYNDRDQFLAAVNSPQHVYAEVQFNSDSNLRFSYKYTSFDYNFTVSDGQSFYSCSINGSDTLGEVLTTTFPGSPIQVQISSDRHLPTAIGFFFFTINSSCIAQTHNGTFKYNKNLQPIILAPNSFFGFVSDTPIQSFSVDSPWATQDGDYTGMKDLVAFDSGLSCPQNYNSGPNGGSECYPVNPCADNTFECQPHSHCVYVRPGEYNCRCDTGYEGGDVCSEINVCGSRFAVCNFNATCQSTGPGTYTCTCKPGYTGNGTVCTAVCTPQNCSSLGVVCGSTTDGCGNQISCGSCRNTETCSADGTQCLFNTCTNGQCGSGCNAIGSISHRSGGTWEENGESNQLYDISIINNGSCVIISANVLINERSNVTQQWNYDAQTGDVNLFDNLNPQQQTTYSGFVITGSSLSTYLFTYQCEPSCGVGPGGGLSSTCDVAVEVAPRQEAKYNQGGVVYQLYDLTVNNYGSTPLASLQVIINTNGGTITQIWNLDSTNTPNVYSVALFGGLAANSSYIQTSGFIVSGGTTITSTVVSQAC